MSDKLSGSLTARPKRRRIRKRRSRTAADEEADGIREYPEAAVIRQQQKSKRPEEGRKTKLSLFAPNAPSVFAEDTTAFTGPARQPSRCETPLGLDPDAPLCASSPVPDAAFSVSAQRRLHGEPAPAAPPPPAAAEAALEHRRPSPAPPREPAAASAPAPVAATPSPPAAPAPVASETGRGRAAQLENEMLRGELAAARERIRSLEEQLQQAMQVLRARAGGAADGGARTPPQQRKPSRKRERAQSSAGASSPG